jgi:crotonobetainyl-CoA:carnitine CoA-transferase CaiB-like acyl-CoA transferase
MTTAARPLDGVRVLELARSQTGLRGGMILSDLLAEVIKIEPPVEEICAALGEAGVPVGPVRTIPEVARDPHLWDRQMLVKMDDPVVGEMYVPGVAVKMSKTPGRIGRVPTPGQHTDEIISSVLGYDSGALSNLRSAGAIA